MFFEVIIKCLKSKLVNSEYVSTGSVLIFKLLVEKFVLMLEISKDRVMSHKVSLSNPGVYSNQVGRFR